MNSISANLNIMIKASEKASKILIRDFGEVEKLQVSKKGPNDFVSNADLKAEKIIIEERGLTQGEKLHEDLVSSDELPRLWESEKHYVIMPYGENPPSNNLFSKSTMEIYNSGTEEMFTNDEIKSEILRYLNEV